MFIFLSFITQNYVLNIGTKAVIDKMIKIPKQSKPYTSCEFGFPAGFPTSLFNFLLFCNTVHLPNQRPFYYLKL